MGGVATLGATTREQKLNSPDGSGAVSCQGDHKSDHWLYLCPVLSLHQGEAEVFLSRPAWAHRAPPQRRLACPSEKTTSWVTYKPPVKTKILPQIRKT